MMDNITLEDLAMGKRPKEVMGKKAEKVSPKVEAELKKLNSIVSAAEAKSIKTYKGLNATELKVLLKAYDEIQDTMYRLKEMSREAMKPLKAKMRAGEGKGKNSPCVMSAMMDEY